VPDLKIGSSQYAQVSREIKDFLKFNGYSQTLAKLEAEEKKLALAKREEEQKSSEKVSLA